MIPPDESMTAAILILSVVLQLAATLVALGQMRHVGRYRYAWLAVSMALALMVQRRFSSLLDLMEGHADHYVSALVGLLISGLMLVGMLGLRALFVHMRGQERELVRLATTDALTQANNRRHALELLRHELVRQQRTGRPLAVLVLDLDFFKAVNDSHGHAVGDAVLIGVCDACREALRAMDVFGRLGGEEFVVVLPETDAAQAFASAERLRARVAALEIPAPGATVRITVSIGYAIASGKTTDVDACLTRLLSQADAALYQAKSTGRNRCAAWHPDMARAAGPGADDPACASP